MDSPCRLTSAKEIVRKYAPCVHHGRRTGRALLRLIKAALAGLPAMYQEVFVLADVEGLSGPELAQRLGLSLPAVRSRLHRARLMLRQALAPHFSETSA
jgi:DNA-directed RNA polymerase specialized sigma24 family protein